MSSLETTAPGDFEAALDDARIGRYVYRRLVGSGGMGIVVAAHDPELDREVAIKLVGARTDVDDDRPLREAQAMAKLSHPNVVQVYEVIRLDARTAIVMQLVEGEDLGTWQKREDRAWREVVDAYVQAARGLAAAHRAGIVHRDFKPSNVLVDREGIVRVTDFGLAQRATDETSAAEGLAGTPAYMAPEQHLGATVDARTDQWALGCALYEALYGRRPYVAADRATLAAAVVRGELPPDPTSSPVPRRIRAAIRRALTTDPDERFDTVDDLVAVLAAPPRRVHYAITAGVTVAALVTVALVASRSAPAVCQGLDAPIRAVWTDAVRSQLQTRLLGGDVGLPAATVERALHGLDRYASSWTTTRVGVCKDAQQGVRSADALDTRMRCLDRRLAEITGLLDGLAEGRGATLRAASDAVAQLEPATECADAKDVGARPTNPALRGEIDAAEAALARATALVSLGQFENAMPLADRAAAVGEHAASPSLMARALIVRAECQDRLGRFSPALATLQRAATAAAKARDNTALADTLVREALVDGEHLGHRGDALRMRPFVELQLEAAGQPDAQRAEWLHDLAILLYDDSSRVDEAAADEREALAIRQRTLPPDHTYIFDSMETLANIEAARDHFDESQRLLEQVRDARIAARGPVDHLVSSVYNNLGVLDIRRGNLLAAIDDLQRSVDIGLKVDQPDSAAMFNLALTELDLGHLAEAAKHFEGALEIYKKLAGPEALENSRDVAESATYLGAVWNAQGDYTRGRPMLLHGLEIARRSSSPSLTTALSHAARLALHDGDRAKARALVDEAMKVPASNAPLRSLAAAEVLRAETGCSGARAALAKVIDDAIADEQPAVQAVATVELADCEVALGDKASARKRLEAELARLAKEGADDSALAPARTVLAKAR
jgi:eukaryotic-like serine/threonine-protein kinase